MGHIPKWRLYRIGWKEAKKAVEEDGWTVVPQENGTAELRDTERCAFAYLTSRSLELYFKARWNSKG